MPEPTPPTPPKRRRGATVAQLKADIASGRTGDKVAHSDPGAAPLGTDDEAAGRPAHPEVIQMMREAEARDLGVTDPQGEGGPAQPETDRRGALLLFAFGLVLGVGAAVAMWLS